MQKIILPLLILTLVRPALSDESPETDAPVVSGDADTVDDAAGIPPETIKKPSDAAGPSSSAGSAIHQPHLGKPAVQPSDDPRSTDSSPSTTMTVEWGTTGSDNANNAVDSSSIVPLLANNTLTQHPIRRRSPEMGRHPVLWKLDPEWLALSGGISTYGASGTVSAVTLRWHNVYWETVKFAGGAWKRTIHFFGSSIAGMPIWLSARQEFRVGTGLSIGYMRFKHAITEDDTDFVGSGISAVKVKTYVMLPLEVSYIFHYKVHLAFQVSTFVAFPMNFKVIYQANRSVDPEDYDVDYRPFVSAYAGLRF